MKVLGIVQWTDRDKRDIPIAGVRPLVELQKGEWREIAATEEFPSQGQVFWPNAQTAVEDSLIVFRAEANSGQRDDFKVVDPKPAHEVLDLRSYGAEADVRRKLASGIRLPGPTGSVRALVWCSPDILVGPIELSRIAPGMAKLAGANLHRLAVYMNTQVRSLTVDHVERLLRVDNGAPSSFIDWDDDAVVLRRALEAAVRVAKLSGSNTGQTKKQIEEAIRIIATQGVGPEAQLDRYRIERALLLLENSEVVANSSANLVESLRQHPAIQILFDVLSAKVRSEVEADARNDLDQRLTREHTALQATAEAHAHAKAQLDASQQELRATEERLTEIQSQIARAANAVEAAVNARVRAAIAQPLELLAEVSVLRPLLGGSGFPPLTKLDRLSSRIDWSGSRSDNIKDISSLRRVFTGVARARGVDPALMLQIHSTVVAGLMPVTIGPGALSALTAYADGVCGGRLLIIHVSPNTMQPHDLDDVAGGGLVAATAAAKEIDGLSLVVLEGANRSPLEASVLPLLQLADLGLSPHSSAPGLRLAATLVTGATTVPVTSQLWSHAAAIYPDPTSRSSQGERHFGDVMLSNDLLALGDVPNEVIDALLESWPDCRVLRPTLERLGSALSRLYEEDQRVTEALVCGLVLPFIATELSTEECAEALSKARDTDGSLARALHRLQRRVC